MLLIATENAVLSSPEFWRKQALGRVYGRAPSAVKAPIAPARPGPCGHIHRHIGSPSRHSGVRFHHCDAPTTVIPAPAGIHAPQQPSFRRQPESMPPDNRHSGTSRNPCPPTTVIPATAGIHAPHPTVIPATAGIHAPRQPSFRRQPESMPPTQPSFRRQPESMPLPTALSPGTSPYNRHSGTSRNLCPSTTVIPAPAGTYAVTDGAFAGDAPHNRHSGESRNLCLPAPLP